MATVPFTFEQAARHQFRYGSFYTVFLIAPDGARTYLGFIARRTGAGLMTVLRRDSVQAIVRALPGADSATFKKSADALTLSTGHRITFGGTIRQEAGAA